MDGVPSRTEVTETSGRGVGMAAVRQACEADGGSIDVLSQPGKGTTFRFLSQGCFLGRPLAW
jgi:two-component system, chemotaxis family, sensor kinase CheA